MIRLFIYSRDDEEIYKEFLDIANELIPQIMKWESSGHSAKSILRDPHCFAHLLRFVFVDMIQIVEIFNCFTNSNSDFTMEFVTGNKEV